MNARTAFHLTGRHVLFMLLGFFAVMMTVNATFVWLSLSSWSGLSTEDAYRQGLNHNDTLAGSRRQQGLDWRLAYELRSENDGGAQLTVRLAGSEGPPPAVVRVRADLVRPTHEGNDFSLALTPRGDGVYSANFATPLKGQWDMVILAERRNGERYRLEDRIWIK